MSKDTGYQAQERGYLRREARTTTPQAWDWPLKHGTHRVSGKQWRNGVVCRGVLGLIAGPVGKLP